MHVVGNGGVEVARKRWCFGILRYPEMVRCKF